MINSETLKPSFDGLFCEKIFGPIKDFECSCNRYKNTIKRKKRKQIFICSKCNVELTQSKIRNYRMG
jgi:DNA-directed RNA polymerase subunit beta'